MLTIQEAKNSILEHTKSTETQTMKLSHALGYAIVSDLKSPIDFPPFDQSAMDGYALQFDDLEKDSRLNIIGEEQAGNLDSLILESGTTIRIFTGAKMPKGADTVVIQENVDVELNLLEIKDPALTKGANIRLKGSQTKKGDLVLQKGDTITSATASFIAGLGIEEVMVYKKPRIAIINTGKELVRPGKTLEGSQIYESNSYALVHALRSMHIVPFKNIIVDDEKIEIEKAIREALIDSDMILLTGGVSVGDYDYVIPCLKKNWVVQLFHKVKQKPGKPLYAGRKGDKLIFGLPGNPASVLTCFYIYVFPALRKMLGHTNHELLQLMLPIQNSYKKKKGLLHFLQGKVSLHGVEIFSQQQSYKMNSFAKANALVEIPEEASEINSGDIVKVYIFDV